METLLEKFDPTLVSIYLRAFNQIDETHWPALDEILRADPRLQLKMPRRAGTRLVARPSVLE